MDDLMRIRRNVMLDCDNCGATLEECEAMAAPCCEMCERNDEENE